MSECEKEAMMKEQEAGKDGAADSPEAAAKKLKKKL